MKMKLRSTTNILILLLLILCCGCEKNTPIASFAYETNPKFTWGYVQFYGNYYHNYQLSNNVLTLHLFSEGLTIEEGKLIGKGQHLVLSDVFIQPTDTLLPIGTYTTSDKGEAMTYFDGRNFKMNKDDIPTGTYIHYLTDNAFNDKTALLTQSNLTVQLKNDSIYIISIEGVLEEKSKTVLKGIFEGVLPHIDYTQHIVKNIK